MFPGARASARKWAAGPQVLGRAGCPCSRRHSPGGVFKRAGRPRSRGTPCRFHTAGLRRGATCDQNPAQGRGPGAASRPGSTQMIHDVRRSEFTSLVDPDAPVRQIGTGFTFTEGPLWHPTEHYLLFSDMPGDVRRRWDEAGGVREVMRPANKCNGMTYDAELNLVICEHATSSLVRLVAGRPPRGPRLALRGQGAQQPERRLRALRRHHLLHRPVVRADAALRRRAPARARLAGGLPGVAGRQLTSPSTSASSTSRTGCASRPTRAGSTSTTPPGR